MTLASLPDECCCHLDRHVIFTIDEKYEKLIFCVPPIIYSHAIGLCMAALQAALRAASGKSSAGRSLVIDIKSRRIWQRERLGWDDRRDINRTVHGEYNIVGMNTGKRSGPGNCLM